MEQLVRLQKGSASGLFRARRGDAVVEPYAGAISADARLPRGLPALEPSRGAPNLTSKQKVYRRLSRPVRAPP
jgi:hypothetical protein